MHGVVVPEGITTQGLTMLPVAHGGIPLGIGYPQVYGASPFSPASPSPVSRISAGSPQSAHSPYVAAHSSNALIGGMRQQSVPAGIASWGSVASPSSYQFVPSTLTQSRVSPHARFDALVASIRAVGTGSPAELQAAMEHGDLSSQHELAEVAVQVAELAGPIEAPAAPAEVNGILVSEESATAAIPASGSSYGPSQSSQQPAQVTLHVYYQKQMTFDENGKRRQRTMGSGFTWEAKKLMQDLLCIYHVGVVVHGREYAFGNYRGSNSILMGSENSGICSHDPQKAGPHNVFKQEVALGSTHLSVDQVLENAEDLANSSYPRRSYDRIHHNCTDFAREFCKRLGAEEPPEWCARAANTARMIVSKEEELQCEPVRADATAAAAATLPDGELGSGCSAAAVLAQTTSPTSKQPARAASVDVPRRLTSRALVPVPVEVVRTRPQLSHGSLQGSSVQMGVMPPTLAIPLQPILAPSLVSQPLLPSGDRQSRPAGGEVESCSPKTPLRTHHHTTTL